jgi:hypothetical protein
LSVGDRAGGIRLADREDVLRRLLLDLLLAIAMAAPSRRASRSRRSSSEVLFAAFARKA